MKKAIKTTLPPALLFGEIEDESALGIITWIIQANLSTEKPDYLHLLINSPGGDMMACFAIVETITSSKIPVHITALGQIQSAGIIIFMAGEKGYRVVTETTSSLSHNFNSSGGEASSYTDLKNLQKEYDRLDQKIISHYIKHTGLTEKEIRKNLVTHSDVYLTPEELVEFNIADVVGPLEY